MTHDQAMNAMKPNRRGFLSGALAGAGALVVAAHLPGLSQAATGSQSGVVFVPNAFLRVDASGIVLTLPKTEMGQGILTAIAMLVAEELEIAPEQIRVELALGEIDRFKPVIQETGGSTSIRETWEPLRLAGATARVALIEAAAAQWQVPAASCVARDGSVIHEASGQSANFAALAKLAADRPLPKAVQLKPAGKFTIIGKSRPRLDGDAKAAGTAQYGMDVRLPGMKVATLMQAPAIGGTLDKFDEAAALAVPGVRHVVGGKDVLFVVADHYWAARMGLEAAAPTFTSGTRATLDTAMAMAQLATADDGAEAKAKGDVAAAFSQAAKIVRAEYVQPFLAHATMEPGNCVAEVKDGKCTIWTGTQVPSSAREAAAKSLGIKIADVTVHNCLMGGGFGRRLETDMVERTIELAKALDHPVKLVWSREEDMRHDVYRPAYHDRIEAALDRNGNPIGWRHRIAGSSIMARLLGDKFEGVDVDAIEGAIEPLYTLPAMRVGFQQVESGLSTGWWRGVGGLRTTFVMESFIDELAHAAGKDPLAYRLSLISNTRARHVLELAASKSDWGTALPKGSGRGIAVLAIWGTYMAAVVETTVGPQEPPRVKRVVVAVDCGQPINPSGISAQVEGGVIFGLSAALHGKIDIESGQVQQSSFHDYRVLRTDEIPLIETHIVASNEAPGGMGEPPAAIIAPALANAVFAASGLRHRSLPLVQAG